MSEKLKVKINGEEQEVETSNINLFCHRGDINLQIEGQGVLEINPETTQAAFRDLTQERWDQLRALPGFQYLWSLVFKERRPDAYLHWNGGGYSHTIGLILMTSYAIANGYRPFWRYPEACLHPSAQLGLADLMICFQNLGPTQGGNAHETIKRKQDFMDFLKMFHDPEKAKR